MSPAVHLHLKKLILWAAPLAGLACGGDGGTDVVLPSLRITTATSGVEADLDGFSVSIDGQAPRPIAASGSITIERLAEGRHTVELSGIAANCALGGENPRSVNVVSGATATVAFGITCSAGTGSIQVVTTTTGASTDPDGFALLLDGTDRGPIGVSATSSLGGLTPGSHTVGLSGLAANCQVSGENPRAVAVSAGGMAEAAFAVVCTEPGLETGAIQVVTTTSGAGTDPDGYSLLLDGSAHGPIGVSATGSLGGITAGSHTIGLTGLAANCQLSGENPRPVSVPPEGTVHVAFEVTCTAAGPATGTLVIATLTTGPAQDADGYLISVDGGTGQPIGTSATVTLANVSAAQHTVELAGLAGNCAVTGDNPLGVAVEAGQTARISFAVTCAATVGSLRVTISGLPGSADAAVTVSGPNNFSAAVTETRTLSALPPGSYAVSAADVITGGDTYTPSVSLPTVQVVAGATASVTVSYTETAQIPTLNLRIDGLNLTQSTQTYASNVPLVAGRAGYLRVFVLANESNTARPAVRVRFRNGSSTSTRNIDAPGGSTPSTVLEGTLGSSWNLPVEAALVRPGLTIEATVDPGGSIAESNEGDNQITKALRVQTVPAARIRFVSIQQGSSAPGNVSNPGQLIALARRVHPLNAIEVDVRSGVFTASQSLQPGGEGWGQVLGDLDAQRLLDADGGNRIYFGIAKLDYARSQGLVGLAFSGLPSATTALGWDDTDDASRVVAHELGHIWGRRHSPCGSPPEVDLQYPYPGGQIGVYGLDVTPPVTAADLMPLSSPDIMSYCFQNPWISDYTYQGIMSFRAANASAVLAGQPQPSLLVWGRIVNGRAVLEPSFEVVARPSLPTRPGPYSVSGIGEDGSRLFTLSFDVAKVEESPSGNGHFAFVVPMEWSSASRLSNLSLQGPTGSVSSSRAPAQLRTGPVSESIVARREGENVSLRWNPAVHPMIMVRDPDNGEVLAFARGGTALVRTPKSELDLEVSDGVSSQRVRLAINRS